ncbi:MAG: VWA domain-containing protein [Planctomycetaceae bacterium]|nr:VWA domain-containing protein [Planctomycetaceae bacterium]
MMNFTSLPALPSGLTSSMLFAQTSIEMTEWSWPDDPWKWLLALVLLGLAISWCIEIYRRDSRVVPLFWRILLPTLRLAALAGLLIVFLNPRMRTQTWSTRPSRVAILVDTSSSMLNPASDEAGDGQTVSRYDDVLQLLQQGSWLNDLIKTHEVSIYGFDSRLSSRLVTLPIQKQEGTEEPSSPPQLTPKWDELLQPTGSETRLGEVTTSLIREIAGRTLAGIVVVSDGGGNSGIDVRSANDLARQMQVKMISLGTGGTAPPVNLEVAKLVAPTDVQMGDPFDIDAYVRGEGLAGKRFQLELNAREPAEGSTFYQVETQEVEILEDQNPVQVHFTQAPKLQGEWEYQVRLVPDSSVKEIKTSDNQRTIAVNVFERPLRVLLFAGGPSWDYRFLCGVLNRHPGFEVDAYLQTGGAGISQDVDKVLLEFPGEKSELFSYDVAVCFDPDWSKIPEAGRALFEQWIDREGAGVIFIAGDINTPFLAGSRDELQQILDLYPVVLDSILPGIDLVSASTQERPLELTADGKSMALMNVADDSAASETFWNDFPGFFRFYPTSGPKSGAIVYATAGGVGELTEVEAPIVISSQLYGQGRTFYLGSPEFYRVRAEDPEFFERFWSRICREAGQNRMKRSNPRGTLLVDQAVVPLGDVVKIRARLLDAEFEAYRSERVDLEVETPDGRLLSPAASLRPDPAQAGAYVGEVRTQLAGRYQIRLTIPGTEDVLQESIAAELPDLENRELQQNVRQLQTLAEGTGGTYLPIGNASQVIPLLKDSSEQFLLGEQIKTLWDRTWFLLILVGLLGIEWLARKMLQLA